MRVIYEDPVWTLELMDKYGAEYLFVGDVERELYWVNLPEEGLTQVFTADGVSIYQRNN